MNKSIVTELASENPVEMCLTDEHLLILKVLSEQDESMSRKDILHKTRLVGNVCSQLLLELEKMGLIKSRKEFEGHTWGIKSPTSVSYDLTKSGREK